MRAFMLSLGLGVVAIGCASHAASAPPTALKGTLAASTFPGAPTAVVARNSKGAELRAVASATGDFTLTLAKGESYALSVELADRRVPLAMARRSGKLDASFKVSSNGAALNVGSVRYLAAGSKTITAAVTANGCVNGNGECSDDSEQTTCDNGQSGSDNSSDGECQNGVDTTTHAPCTDPAGDNAEQVDANSELAIPEHSAPADVSGCDDGEEADD